MPKTNSAETWNYRTKKTKRCPKRVSRQLPRARESTDQTISLTTSENKNLTFIPCKGHITIFLYNTESRELVAVLNIIILYTFNSHLILFLFNSSLYSFLFRIISSDIIDPYLRAAFDGDT